MSKQAKTLTPQDLRRVMDYVATRPHAARNRAIVLMMYYAGLRVGETASLRLGVRISYGQKDVAKLSKYDERISKLNIKLIV